MFVFKWSQLCLGVFRKGWTGGKARIVRVLLEAGGPPYTKIRVTDSGSFPREIPPLSSSSHCLGLIKPRKPLGSLTGLNY